MRRIVLLVCLLGAGCAQESRIESDAHRRVDIDAALLGVLVIR